jgi:hypothetical protein
MVCRLPWAGGKMRMGMCSDGLQRAAGVRMRRNDARVGFHSRAHERKVGTESWPLCSFQVVVKHASARVLVKEDGEQTTVTPNASPLKLIVPG